jgi:glycosyltransferase involved in cell wall biosynthesis
MRTEDRLRVLHVGKYYHPFRGGMETHLRALCTELRTTIDIEVIVASTARTTTHEVVDGVPVTRIGTLANVASAPITPGMAGEIRRRRSDIVHVHLPHPTAILSYLASGHRGPLVVTYHSDIIRQRMIGAAFAPILHHFLSRASAIICTSPNYIESSRVLRAHRDRCRVVPFSIASDACRDVAAVEVERIRSLYGPRIVLGVGRLIYYKGFEYLVEAMRDIDARLLIIGEGPLRDRLTAMAESIGIADRVVLLGSVGDAFPYYQAADVFVLPSIARSEAFGLVQLEAMACGTPVVNTRLDSGVPYVSIDGETGRTVPPANARALATAIAGLLDDPIERARLGAAARRRVQRHFTVDLMAAGTLAIYRAVLAGEPLPGTGSAHARSPRYAGG